jgi:hypothetical protein
VVSFGNSSTQLEFDALKVQLREKDEAHQREVEAIKVQLRESDIITSRRNRWDA